MDINYINSKDGLTGQWLLMACSSIVDLASKQATRLYRLYYHICTRISEDPNFIFVFTVPSKVGHLTLTKAARSGRPALTLTWTAPQSDRPITKYQVQYRRSGATSWSAKDVTSRSTTLENLPAGTGYQVQVRAVSDVGTGPYSDVRTITTYRGIYYRMFHHLLVYLMLY